MKNLLITTTILLLISSCGRDADPVSAPKQLLEVSANDYLEAEKSLETEVREINFFSIPNKDDLVDFSFAEGDSLFDSNLDAWGRVLSHHKIGASFAGKYFHKYPCFMIKEGNNEGKCLLKEVEGVTSFIPNYPYSCEKMVVNYGLFKNLVNDERIPSSFSEEFVASSSTLNEMINDIKGCFNEAKTSHMAGISKNLSSLDKEISFSTYIFNIANVRDKGWRTNIAYLEKENALIETLEKKYFKNFKCYQVRKGTNKRKCYLAKLSRVTKSRPERIRSCEDLEEIAPKFEGLVEDDQIPTESRSKYIITDSDLAQLKDDIIQCKKEEGGRIKRYQSLAHEGRTLRDDGKILVRELLSQAELKSGRKFMTTAATLHDEDVSTGKLSQIYIDLNEMSISDETRLAIDFQTGEGIKYYSPSLGNMTSMVVKRKYNAVANYTYYTVHFKFFVSNGMIVETDPTEDKGLSFDTNGTFGARMSGKMLFHYPDGSTRRGIMKIEVNYSN